MNCTILCPGPSLKDYQPSGDEIVISAHFPLSDDTTHLCEGTALNPYGWQPLPTITMVTRRPLHTPADAKWPSSVVWEEEDRWDWVKNLVVDGLRVFHPATHYQPSTGELAILWALHSCTGTITCWGMDSLWGENSNIKNTGDADAAFRAASRLRLRNVIKHQRVIVMRDGKPYKLD